MMHSPIDRRKLQFAFHPLAQIFPLMDGSDFDALVSSIQTNGQREPIVLLDGMILDGRNRWRACQAIGIDPAVRNFDRAREGDPLAFTLDANLRRRHLDESQRAMVAARLATLRDGQRADLVEGLPIGRASDLLNVGERSVARAREVIGHGAPELIEAVDQGKLAVSKAANMLDEPPEYQQAFLRRLDDGMPATEAARQTRREFLPEKIKALPTGQFRVVYADPPWKYNDARRTGDHRETTGVLAHYADMSIDELCALEVKRLRAPDCVLLMWAVFPLLPDALRLIESWGFQYKTAFVWDKVFGSFGHYHNAEAELLMIATHGSCTPDAEKKEKQIHSVKRTEHSAKPECWREMIDRTWTNGPRIELFRRGETIPGWETWGAEADDA